MTAAVLEGVAAPSISDPDRSLADTRRPNRPGTSDGPRLVAVPETEPPWDTQPIQDEQRQPVPDENGSTRPPRPRVQPRVRDGGRSPARSPQSPRSAGIDTLRAPSRAASPTTRRQPGHRIPAQRRAARPTPWSKPVSRTAIAHPLRRRPAFRVATISATSVPGWSREADVGVALTTTAALPPAEASAAALARAVLEALSDCRPLEQLRARCAPDVFAGLQDAPHLGRRGSTRLLTARVCQPADGVAEVSAVFRCAEHVRALAMRLQGVDGRWRITALQMG